MHAHARITVSTCFNLHFYINIHGRRRQPDRLKITSRKKPMEKVLAAVRVGPSQTEIREYPMPEIPADSALLKVEQMP